MELTFGNRTALVTGGSRGIGGQTVRMLAASGVRVAFCWREDEAGARAVSEEIRAAGGEALAVRADVRDGDAVRRMVDEVLGCWGRLDVLVNNAALLVTGRALDSTPQALRDSLEANFLSATLCTQAVLPAMTAGGWGRIVNVASTGVFGTTARSVMPLTAAKAALVIWTKQLAQELGPRAITVNAVCPGAIDTEVTLPGGALHESIREIRRGQLERTALGRAGTAREVAALIAFLASEEAAFITGQAISIDGGRSDFLTHSG